MVFLRVYTSVNTGTLIPCTSNGIRNNISLKTLIEGDKIDTAFASMY